MIVRIMGEGQLSLAELHLAELNTMDDALTASVNAGDDAHFALRLTALIDRVRALGAPVPDEYLGGSDLILPAPDSSLTEVRMRLGEEGLIPG
jgi:hypothetical protein